LLRPGLTNRVVDQIPEENRQKSGIAGDEHRLFVREFDVDWLRQGGGRKIAGRGLQHSPDLHRRWLKGDGVRCQPSEHQHLLDDVGSAITSGNDAVQGADSFSTVAAENRLDRFAAAAAMRAHVDNMVTVADLRLIPPKVAAFDRHGLQRSTGMLHAPTMNALRVDLAYALDA
jgi:hypothetical protein